ncbi:hypothetical protein J2129_001439 [Methanofollis sp. W23]|nr:hypothetical protein [Methanofollis sp. W23]
MPSTTSRIARGGPGGRRPSPQPEIPVQRISTEPEFQRIWFRQGKQRDGHEEEGTIRRPSSHEGAPERSSRTFLQCRDTEIFPLSRGECASPPPLIFTPGARPPDPLRWKKSCRKGRVEVLEGECAVLCLSSKPTILPQRPIRNPSPEPSIQTSRRAIRAHPEYLATIPDMMKSLSKK